MSDYISHFGVKGQKWGIRRYQNPDGSLTAEGKARYNQDSPPKRSKKEQKMVEEMQKNWDRLAEKEYVKAINASVDLVNNKLLPELNKKYEGCDFDKLEFDEYGDVIREKSDPKLADLYEKYNDEFYDITVLSDDFMNQTFTEAIKKIGFRPR